MSDPILRDKARDLIRAGKLAHRRPDRIWGGRGVGGIQCMLCGVPLGPDEVALEVEFGGADDAGAANPHFHVRCFSALEAELGRPEAAGRAPSCKEGDGGVKISPHGCGGMPETGAA